MSDSPRTLSNEAMEKIIGNMTAEMQNIDGQYVPLGFTPPPATTEPLNWSQHPQPSFINRFSPNLEQFPQQPFNYLPQTPQMFEPNGYKKNLSDYDLYKMQNGNPDLGLFDTEYSYMPQIMNPVPDHPLLHHDSVPVSNPTQLIDLVGNWMVPNNSGTYTPFGTSEYKPNVFDLPSDLNNGTNLNMKEDNLFKSDQLDDVQFQFNRDTRKPRMVAEVKPMRPSYSDVLTKPVAQTVTKSLKNEAKENKLKKESKKNNKNEKNQKVNGPLGKSTVNNDIKDVSADKNSQTKQDKKTAKGIY